MTLSRIVAAAASLMICSSAHSAVQNITIDTLVGPGNSGLSLFSVGSASTTEYIGSNATPWFCIRIFGTNTSYYISEERSYYSLGYYHVPFEEGDVISQDRMTGGIWASSTYALDYAVDTLLTNTPIGESSNIAFRISSEGLYNFGYLNYTTISNNSVRFNYCYYDDVTGESITVVPEASQSALACAVAAFGCIFVVRRRTKQAAC